MTVFLIIAALGIYTFYATTRQQEVSEEMANQIREVETKLMELEIKIQEEEKRIKDFIGNDANRIYQLKIPKKKTITERVKGFFTKNKEK